MFWRGVWGYLPANIVQGVVGFGAIWIFTRLLSAAVGPQGKVYAGVSCSLDMWKF